MVFVGRFRTRLKVSRILDVVIWSLDVLFQMERMSSCQETEAEAEDRSRSSTGVDVTGTFTHCWSSKTSVDEEAKSPSNITGTYCNILYRSGWGCWTTIDTKLPTLRLFLGEKSYFRYNNEPFHMDPNIFFSNFGCGGGEVQTSYCTHVKTALKFEKTHQTKLNAMKRVYASFFSSFWLEISAVNFSAIK